MRFNPRISVTPREETSIRGRQNVKRSEESPSTPFAQVFQNLMGKRRNGEQASEEELFAAAIGQQVKELFGVDTYQEYKLAFKIGMSEAVPGRSGPSAERAARLAVRDLVKLGKLTSEQARDIRDAAFAAAQLDDNVTKLFDGTGGANDPTKATEQFDRAAQLATERMFLFKTSGEIPRPTTSRSILKYRRNS